MRELWFIAVIALSFGLFFFQYYGGNCSSFESIDVISMRTLMFLFLYFILKIYMYHIVNLYQRLLAFISIPLKFATIILPLVASVLAIESPECEDVLHVYQLIIVIPLFLLLLDFKGKIGDVVIDFYESRLGDRSSDMFIKYPPRDIGDIIFQIIFVLIIVLVISLIQ